jgi:hypothetical protein
MKYLMMYIFLLSYVSTDAAAGGLDGWYVTNLTTGNGCYPISSLGQWGTRVNTPDDLIGQINLQDPRLIQKVDKLSEEGVVTITLGGIDVRLIHGQHKCNAEFKILKKARDAELWFVLAPERGCLSLRSYGADNPDQFITRFRGQAYVDYFDEQHVTITYDGDSITFVQGIEKCNALVPEKKRDNFDPDRKATLKRHEF